MRVKLLYFAVLRDIMGEEEAVVTLPEGARAESVWAMLRERHPALARYERPPMLAINEDYAPADSELKDGDELAFIPPVAGG